MSGDLGAVSPAVVFARPRPEPFWPAPSFSKALEFALESHARRRIALLLGPRGCGKSTVLNAFLARAPHSVFFRFREGWDDGAALLAALAASTEVPGEGNTAAAHEQRFVAFLEAERQRGLTTILAVDDAELLPADAWRVLQRLASIDLHGYRPHLLIVGRPEAEAGLRAVPEWAGVPISTYLLAAPSPADVAAYIEFRLMAAGLAPAVIGPAARECVAARAGGSLARVDLLCQGGMLLAHRRGLESVTEELVSEADETFGEHIVPSMSTRAPASAVRAQSPGAAVHRKVGS